MPLDLNALAATFTTKDVAIRGQTCTVRALSDAEVTELRWRLPRPTVPLGRDPTKGSNAPLVPNPDDPAHKRDISLWYAKVAATHAAVAIDQADADGRRWTGCTDADKPKYIESVSKGMMLGLTSPEINGIVETSTELAEAAFAAPESLVANTNEASGANSGNPTGR